MGIKISLSQYDCWDDVKGLTAEIDARINAWKRHERHCADRAEEGRHLRLRHRAGFLFATGLRFVIALPDSRSIGSGISYTENGESGRITWQGIPVRVREGEKVSVTISRKARCVCDAGHLCARTIYTRWKAVHTSSTPSKIRQNLTTKVEFEFWPGAGNPLVFVVKGDVRTVRCRRSANQFQLHLAK